MKACAMSAAHPLHTLYSHHHGWLQGWLRRQMGCAESAADLTQDTFVRLLARPVQSLAPELLRAPRAYLTTVARGLLVDFWRRGDLERAYLADLALQPQRLQPSPEERLAAVQMLQAVDALLQGLTPKTRAAWLMSRLDGLGHAEIAAQLGVSVPRVRQYLANAVRYAYHLRFGAAP
jgi:RNA polymerase sigma-70 factor (ECF subfamily)